MTDFRLTGDRGTGFALTPQTDAARDWTDNVAFGEQVGPSIKVETDYVDLIISALDQDGLTIAFWPGGRLESWYRE